MTGHGLELSPDSIGQSDCQHRAHWGDRFYFQEQVREYPKCFNVFDTDWVSTLKFVPEVVAYPLIGAAH